MIYFIQTHNIHTEFFLKGNPIVSQSYGLPPSRKKFDFKNNKRIKSTGTLIFLINYQLFLSNVRLLYDSNKFTIV